MSQPHPISKAEAARMREVSRAAVTQACNGPLAEAILPNGRIDANHPAFRAWLEGAAQKKSSSKSSATKKTAKASPKAPVKRSAAETKRRQAKRGYSPAKESIPKVRGRKTAPKPPPLAHDTSADDWPPAEGPGSDEELNDLSSRLRPIVARYGSEQGAVDAVDLWKKVEETIAKRLANSRARGELIQREYVQNYVLAPIEQCSMNMLRDLPANLARTVPSMHEAGATHEEIEAEIRKQASDFLKDMQASMLRAMRHA